ncbi:hypothetical protein ACFQHV_12430 [Promicromonospora thailandica]|uniref:Uncharacterized protein n=1 Tax=Promicromonospora thailandica TaxID=765201 RepID=A0A9X2JX65_9MICO|nr:hypothetical protein [Promicromonospora thailandica]MCP2265878.1 hypothetical protein [Promicromonospora thailandica]BFF21555.1 hypothetical protein GCM10025730_50760 [Promicromonospora thailandica]
MTARSAEVPAGVGVAGWTWWVDPPARWLVVPAVGLDDPADVARWEREAVGVVRASLEPEPGPEPDPDPGPEPDSGPELDDAARAGLDRLAADAVANLRAFADGVVPSGSRVLAALGVHGNGPVPVLVAVGVSDPAEPDDGLMAALGATGGEPAAPPNVEHLDLPDGDGVRVVRLDMDEAGTGWMSVAVGRRVEHPDAVVDTVLVWRTVDLFLVATMAELLDELLPAVRVERSAADRGGVS